MNETAIEKLEAIALLKMSIEFGADEAISVEPQDRLAEQPSKTFPAKTSSQSSVQRESNGRVHSGLQQKSIGRDDEISLAAQYASECGSVTEITRAINDFPYFKKNNKGDKIEFYQGAKEPSVVVLREPEIYNIQSHDKKLLYERIVNSVEIMLNGKCDSICGSLVTFPLFFDKTEPNEHFNSQLLLPFLFQYIYVLKPKVLIAMGGFNSDDYDLFDGKLTNLKFFKDLLMVDFPSLDVLVRAPKRKKDVWNKILELKRNYDGEDA